MPTVNFAPDIRAVTQIQAVPMILRLVKHLTGLRFAAVVRVTEKHWVTCAVDDSLSFGLQPGDELELESTICHEIRQHRQPVVFGDASNHQVYATHHTPLRLGRLMRIRVGSLVFTGIEHMPLDLLNMAQQSKG